ncbi:MAG: TonB-dependent receptor [Bryobacterales bacterium]|nr:TonB-dependent receptor [Bryobacterales bacterium]
MRLAMWIWAAIGLLSLREGMLVGGPLPCRVRRPGSHRTVQGTRTVRRRGAAVAITASLLICAPQAFAMKERAAIGGAVSDGSGARVPEAAVSVTNDDTGLRRTVRSDSDGAYRVASLAPGTYKVTVRKPGFQTVTQLNVELRPAEQTQLDFVLTIGSMKQVITIESVPPMTNTDDASVGTRVPRRLFESLPLNGRGLMSLAELAPGVTATPVVNGEAGQFTANGQRANAHYFTVDGVSANTGVAGSGLPAQFTGGTLPGMTAFGSLHGLVSLEALEELRIQTSTFAPEFGRMPGAQVMLSTRSGTEQFHGSLFLALRQENLNANVWTANRDGLERSLHRLRHGGGSFGGPLWRGRTYVFSTWELMRLRQPINYRVLVPSAAAREAAPAFLRPVLDAFPMPNRGSLDPLRGEYAGSGTRPSRLDSGSLRLDHAITSLHNLFFRYHHAPSSTDFGALQVFRSDFSQRALTIGVTSVVRPNLVHDLRVNQTVGHSESAWFESNAGVTAPDLRPYAPGPGYTWYALSIAGLGGWITGNGGRNRQTQWSAVDTLSWTRGRHAVRFGGEYQRLLPSRDYVATSAAMRYGSLEAFVGSQGLEFAVERADRASSRIENLSIFVQDTWRWTPALTLTYGTRWEVAPAPGYIARNGLVNSGPGITGGTAGPSSGGSPPLGPPSIGFPGGPTGTQPPLFPGLPFGTLTPLPVWPTRYTQFAPRVAIAWSRGRTVWRAGWGIFYDLGFSAATDPINGAAFNRWQLPSLGAGVAGGGRSGGYGEDLRLPYSHQWNASMDFALTAQDVLTASYAGSAGRRLMRREVAAAAGFQVTAVTNNGRSEYHSMQLQYRRKLSRRWQGVASYSWSRAMDNGSWDTGLFLTSPEIRDWAAASFDVRHSLTVAFSHDLGGVLNGWRLHGFLRARSAFPMDVLGTENELGLGFDNAPRPDRVPGVPVWINDGSPGGRRLNPAAFQMRPQGQGGLPRNSIRGFGFSQVDLAADRRIVLRDNLTLNLRLEAFNVLNQASFGDPVRFLNTPYFGRSIGTVASMLGRGSPNSGLAPALQIGGPRTLQLQVQLRF